MWVEVALFVLLIIILTQFLKKPDGLPPGRWGLPITGYIPLFNKKDIEKQLEDLHKEHGDVYIWRFGSVVQVFLHDYRMIRELYNRSDILDRPNWLTFHVGENPPMGVFATNGKRWHNNRRFSLRQLRDLGMGKSKLVGKVQEQAQWLVKEMKKMAGKPAPIPYALNIAITNIIWQMVGSRQFEATDPQLKSFQDDTDAFLLSVTSIFIVDFFPWVNYLPKKIVDKFCKTDIVDNLKEKFVNFFTKVIKEKKAALDRDDPRDVIESYLVAMEEEKDDEEAPFTERDLCFVALDLFFAGSTTTIDTTKFIMFYMASNPHVQTKMQKEIDTQLNGAIASLEDRSRLPYTDAVIHEVLRMSSLVAPGVSHVVANDMEIGGYKVPKGSVLNTVAVSIHHDPRYWKDPHTFLPERWLDEQGKFVSKKEGFIPFSVGKRNCLGEALAKMELFIFTATLFQSLSVSSPPGKTINPKHDPDKPFFHAPIQQDILVTERH